MVCPLNLTDVAVNMASQQISDAITGKAWGMVLFAMLSTIGFVAGAKIKNEIAKGIGLIFGLLGAIGAIEQFQTMMSLTQCYVHP